MSYQILNNNASIKFVHENGEVLLMKDSIYDIAMMEGDIIKISSGDCGSGFHFRHKDVTAPITANVILLVDLIGAMLNPNIETPPSR